MKPIYNQLKADYHASYTCMICTYIKMNLFMQFSTFSVCLCVHTYLRTRVSGNVHVHVQLSTWWSEFNHGYCCFTSWLLLLVLMWLFLH